MILIIYAHPYPQHSHANKLDLLRFAGFGIFNGDHAGIFVYLRLAVGNDSFAIGRLYSLV